MKTNLENRPSIERIREVLAYEPDTGILRWKISSGRAFAGNEAGHLDKKTGYIRVRIDGCFIQAHHCAWAIVEGYWPERLDHRRGKEAGNGWDNLRLATQSQNMGNINAPAHNTSGIKGVSFHKATGKWQAQINVNRKRVSLGVFASKEDAAAAYATAAADHFGEFARTEDGPTVVPRAPRRTTVRTAGPRRRPTVEEVRSSLVYDKQSGDLRWGFGGAIAGQLTKDGYIRVGLFGKQYYAHVLAWVVVKGEWPTLVIHHDDTVRSNNRWVNLFQVPQSENILEHYRRSGQDRRSREITRPLYKRK